MFNIKTIRTVLIAIILADSSAVLASVGLNARRFDDLGGFEIGTSFADAQRHAEAKGWQLSQFSPDMPGEWRVDGTNLGLYACNDRIVAIRKNLEGSIDEFAEIVMMLRSRHGEPSMQALSFPIGTHTISNIDARFAPNDRGTSVAVQLSSLDGKPSINMNYYSELGCSDEPVIGSGSDQ